MAGRYEDLRAAVLGGVDRGSRHGWAVLARSGMAAWIKAVVRIPVASRVVQHEPSAPVAAPVAVAGELVEVLARMAWTAAGGCRSG
ncbi:hypothetical protein [Streptomyces sp. NBC_00154]|uniref:hypothetical protein n=1 Tax=Streptomyces sp. NBC_00154 TaxID=2975670 RepID=UPI00225C1E6F|nr:hypothetical protein [Streptomyces sp. NBC_00154]MCX5317237.1 hypothetical protein [Streptomyces sp. NBC_00154]MCX5317747.1 hypothetical protein [Streptomyces sp. NBC_00154]